MKKPVIVIFLLICFTAAVWAQNKMTDWKFYADISKPESTSDYFLIPLNGEIYDHVRSDFGDLRIIDETGKEIPFVIYIPERKAGKVMQTAAIINKGIKEGEFTTLTLDLKERQNPVNRIELDITSTNFLRQVKVEGSADLSDWIVINSSRHIFDSSDQTTARSTAVTFDDTTYRYLRITVYDRGDEPLDIHGASFGRQQIAEAAEIVLPATIVSMSGQSEIRDSLTQSVFDLGNSFPSHRITLETNEVNFHRTVLIYGSQDGENYTQLGQGVVYRYVLEGIHDESLTIPYAESRSRFIRVEVFSGNNDPLSITGGHFYSLPRYLLAEAKGTGTHRLYYGAAQQLPPWYDLTNLVRLIDVESKPQAQLLSQSTNPDYQPPKQPWSEENQWLLWGILALVVLLLGTLILRNMKKVT
ncbi:MAG: DUF3999 family protein [Clostridiales bacterium]|jgi:hypothetical protein|nr:DUF3999 family protein [Clostridiales bacterium]